MNLDALEQALGDVVARHESLRTVFGQIDGEPFQDVLPVEAVKVSLSVESIAESELARRLSQAASSTMDLEGELPLRVWVFRLSPQVHVVLILMHHIASDGGSMEPLFRDLSTAYQSRLGGEAPGYEPLPVQYGDYTLWQRELLGEASDPESLLSKQLAYWQQKLAGLPEELPLPTDRPRPSVSRYEGGLIPFAFDAQLHAGVRAVAHSNGATVFMVVQVAWVALLSRLGAGDDIAMGTPIAGRGESALEDLVGFFVNTLVLRIDGSGDPSLVELVARVREAALEAYGHADVPFERVVEALNPERSLSRHPVFQVMLVFQPPSQSGVELPGLSMQVEGIEGGVSKFDLTLSIQERLGSNGEALGLVSELEYSTDLFEPETARMLVVRLERLLGSAVASPELPLHRLEVLSESERAQVLEGFNATMHPMPETTVVEQVEGQVASRPNAPAVLLGEQTVSYGELNAAANRLAHHLIELGVGPETLVGVCLERSVELVVALVGILKAGGAYVPLDPTYPPARLTYMLEDAKPSVVISTQSLAAHLPPGTALLTLDTDSTQAILAQCPVHNPSGSDRPGGLLPDHPAYVIYTSGSTGEPKGVVLSHRGIPSLVAAHVDRMQLTPQARMLQFASSNFDVSLGEVAIALTSGAALVLLSEEARSGYRHRCDLAGSAPRLEGYAPSPQSKKSLLRSPTLASC